MTSPPTDFPELKSRIASGFASLSPQLQHIATFTLEHPNEVAFGTVARIAETAAVQPSALVRFAQTLGYDGFSDMQRVFRARLAAQHLSYRDRIDTLYREAPERRRDGPAATLERFSRDGIGALEHLRQTLQPAEIGRAAKLVADARRVFVLAHGRSFAVAVYLAYALMRFEFSVELLDGIGGMSRERAQRAGTRDLLIVISFKQYAQDVLDIARAARERSVPVLAITDSAVSPLTALAVLAFELGEDGDQPFRSLVAPICLAQILAVAAGERSTPSRTGRPHRRRGSQAVGSVS